ncbi:M14 family zinc carboxypeptidase [Echinimonas agarilytica]|uniref:DUF2817 domain-containing protein n=1 Tax=Echinimonas agarilytica TaxID=1215918 RepID=A0AA42B7X5_9GAMM|nr:M14 family zinc carboxypeptidase [Echinimonas agarilytica]MCM2680665.1 DUF2817 domain-containing protein [Echinimonas agarilytica]
MSERLYDLKQNLPELFELESLIERAGSKMRCSVIANAPFDGSTLPVHLLEMGSTDPLAPAIGFVGGVHGVERIGSQVILAYLQSLLSRMRWDDSLQDQLDKVKLFMIPIVNPGGMFNNTRCNPNGIDLMRNAPIEAKGKVPKLLGGHRYSRHLPWYRGLKEDCMEPELQGLHDYMRQHVLGRPFTMTLDCHSGFGFHDRLWFPYAGSFTPIADLNTMYRVNRLFVKTFPNHTLYKVEPQAHSYTTHGDVWDLLYDHSLEAYPNTTFLPLTLEMGSWLWVKKNPRQLLKFGSLFNPMLPHRQRRILRRHYPLMDFMMMATRSHSRWQKLKPTQVSKDTRAALKLWYDEEGHSK